MASTEIDFQPAKPKKAGIAGKWEGFKTFCYNPQNGTFCGRTGKSWGKIGAFYFVYYVCLAAFCVGMWAIFFTTIDRKEPKQQGMDSLIKGNPGMAFIPMPNVETTLIKFKTAEDDTYKKYIDTIDTFLKPYRKDLGDKVTDCSTGVRADPNKPCKFNIADLGDWCTPENKYGYYEGQPCILMKMNRVFSWEPDVYNDTDTDLPNTPMNVVFNTSIVMTCEEPRVAGYVDLGPIMLYPDYAFPASFYPYRSQEGYLSPIVMVRFINVQKDKDVNVWCRAWARNLENDNIRDRNAGVFGWEADEYNNSSRPAPSNVADRVIPGFLPISCDPEQNSDYDTIGEVQYYPPGGFNTAFFPYTNADGYMSPLVFARFKNPIPGTLVQVWCKVWANNIYHHKNDKAGSFRFELLVN